MQVIYSEVEILFDEALYKKPFVWFSDAESYQINATKYIRTLLLLDILRFGKVLNADCIKTKDFSPSFYLVHIK